MPGLDGLELARLLRRFERPPAVVFVSAYDDFAVRAFELEALDYLVKPVSRRRLDEAIDRVGRAGPGGAEDEMLAVDAPRGGTRLVARSSILFLQAHGDYVRVVADDGRFLLRAALVDLEERWARHGFLRVHRSFVVNLRRAVEVRPRAQRHRGAADGRRDRGPDRSPPGRRAAQAARGVSGRTPRDELRDTTEHGGLYLRRLMRAQLGLSLLTVIAFGGLVGSLPLALYLLPGLQDVEVLGLPLPLRDRRAAAVPGLHRVRDRVRAPRGGARGGVPRSRRAAGVIALAAIVAVTGATVGLGLYGVRVVRTTSDLFVASRAVTPWWNAAAISGEYLSAASFLGIAGLQMKLGSGALWLPLGFTAGYLALLLFVAAPLRRLGAYTISDFAESRLGSAAAADAVGRDRARDRRLLPRAAAQGRGADARAR